MTSKQPRKQRKSLYDIEKHKRKQIMRARLSKELTKEHKKRNVTIVKGDTVKVVRGKFSGKTGKVTGVFLSGAKIGIEGITKKKPNGKEKPIPIQPSNVIITNLNLSDIKRKETIQRGMKS